MMINDSKSIPLSGLEPGQRGTIVRVGGNRHVRRRYLEMGLVRGETIKVEGKAPLGDPVEYLIKGYHLSLRREDADQILVNFVNGQGNG
jgi:Fe2+ transport system protein FeoA